MASGRVAANQLKAAAYRWRWRDYKAYLERIAGIASQADVSPIEFADRQSILLTNPGLNGRLQVTNTIRCAISIYNPGDIAPAHVHSPNASRTILSDKGGYTNVEGERCDAARGDIIITPNGTWHDHGNTDANPVIWIDMLDWPLMEFLDCAWVDQEFHPGSGSNSKSQETIHSNGYSNRLYGSGGMVPTFVSPQLGFGRDPTPMIHFRGARIRESLEALRKEKGDAHEGIQLEFVNPITGKPVFPTMDYQAQLLRPGEATLPKRETSSTFIVVMDGKGKSEIGGQTFDWEANDIMVVPNFIWRRHINTGTGDAVLYTVTDAALLKNIGQYRAQGKDKDGKVIQLVQ
jgi:gentisate 1,2-dioxygenase